jgi:hypothetical protein
MKLLMETWREFIAEIEEPITTLRIFDFDETIAHTQSETRVKAPDGSTAVLRNQQEFENYMNKAAERENVNAFDPIEQLIELGYQIDLSDFSIVKNPSEINIVTDIMRNFSDDSKTYIITARRGDSIGPILSYLDEIGIDSNQVRPIATEGESKGDTIANMIAQKIMPDGKSNISRVEYYEDSERNIQDVLQKVCENENLQPIKPDNFELIIYKVVRTDGIYNLEKITC